MTRLTLATLLLLLAASDAAAAKYSKGVYAEMGLGATAFLGDAGTSVAPGPTFGLRGGYDLLSWFSVGGLLEGSTHEATVPPPPEQEYLQFYRIAADGRITLRYRNIALIAEGGLGVAVISTNVLANRIKTEPDEYTSPIFIAGGGLDYHTQNRHFSVGLAGDLTLYPDFAAFQSVTVRLYLRYTR